MVMDLDPQRRLGRWAGLTVTLRVCLTGAPPLAWKVNVTATRNVPARLSAVLATREGRTLTVKRPATALLVLPEP